MVHTPLWKPLDRGRRLIPSHPLRRHGEAPRAIAGASTLPMEHEAMRAVPFTLEPIPIALDISKAPFYPL